MELLIKEMTQQIIEKEVENLKLKAEITLLRRHLDIINEAFQKPFIVTLGDPQIHQLVESVSKIVLAGLKDPKKLD